jgi:competence protein ComEC
VLPLEECEEFVRLVYECCIYREIEIGVFTGKKEVSKKSIIRVSMQNDQKALVEGLLFGSDEGFSRELRVLTRAAGVTHLVAASGANLRFVTALWNAIFGLFHRKFVQYSSFLGIALYWSLAEQSGSLWRASGMWGITWIGSLWGKRIPLWYSLILTILITALMARTYLSPGFWLSSLAMVGVIFSQKFFSGEKKSALFPQRKFYSKNVALLIAEGTIVFGCVSVWLVSQYNAFEPIGIYSTFLLSFFVDPLVWLGIAQLVLESLWVFLGKERDTLDLDLLGSVQAILFLLFMRTLGQLAKVGENVSPYPLLVLAVLCVLPFMSTALKQKSCKKRWAMLYD